MKKRRHKPLRISLAASACSGKWRVRFDPTNQDTAREMFEAHPKALTGLTDAGLQRFLDDLGKRKLGAKLGVVCDDKQVGTYEFKRRVSLRDIHANELRELRKILHSNAPYKCATAMTFTLKRMPPMLGPDTAHVRRATYNAFKAKCPLYANDILKWFKASPSALRKKIATIA